MTSVSAEHHDGRIRQSRRPYLVSFSGIDGSGKTTQIDALFSWLTEAGLRVQLVRFWDDVAVAGGIRAGVCHKIFKSEQGVGTPGKPVQRRDKNVRAWYLTASRLFLYLLDAFRLIYLVETASQKNSDVIIFDRYLYDELANLEPVNPIVRMYCSWLSRLVPRPDAPFLLDADPEAARLRKPEYPLEFLRSNRASYLSLAKSLGMTILAPRLPEDVTRMVLRSVPRSSLLAHAARVRRWSPARSHQ
jgi:thymidylate kinase